MGPNALAAAQIFAARRSDENPMPLSPNPLPSGSMAPRAIGIRWRAFSKHRESRRCGWSPRSPPTAHRQGVADLNEVYGLTLGISYSQMAHLRTPKGPLNIHGGVLVTKYGNPFVDESLIRHRRRNRTRREDCSHLQIRLLPQLTGLSAIAETPQRSNSKSFPFLSLAAGWEL